MKNSLERCALCKLYSLNPVYYDKTFSPYKVFYSCFNCGLIQQGKEYDRYIPTSTERTQSEEIQHIIDYTSYIISFCQKKLRKIYKEKGNISVLEIGANPNYGCYMANTFHEHFCNSSVVAITLPEYYSKNIDNAVARNWNLKYIDFNKFYDGRISADIIILRHTLEHMENLETVFMNIKSMLTDNGIVFIETPSLYWDELRIDNIFLPGHKFFFTRRMIKKICEYYGFEVLKIKENIFWGNIKLMLQKSTKPLPYGYGFNWGNLGFTMLNKKLIKTFLYPIFRIYRKVRSLWIY